MFKEHKLFINMYLKKKMIITITILITQRWLI